MHLVYLKISRPHQWLKNLMLFFPPFLAGLIAQPELLLRGVVPFVAFSLGSSATYIFNDIMDVERDRQHPVKASRPLAAGDISRKSAIFFMLFLLLVALILAIRTSMLFALLLCLYFLISGLYSFSLKNYPILDVFCIAAGFVVRLYAGGAVFDVVISEWLFLSVFLLALFLSLGKRYSEQKRLGEEATNHRKALDGYPAGFFECCLPLAGGAVLVTYAIYTISVPPLVYSVPLCMFGLLRYLLCLKSGQSGDPTESLLRDPLMFLTGLSWVIMVGWSIY
jgi:4-hydroxybenzoate polyprenyltransferase